MEQNQSPQTPPDGMAALQEMLDLGWQVMLFENQLKSYTAVASHKDDDPGTDPKDDPMRITDDFTVNAVLYRLKRKVLHNEIVGCPGVKADRKSVV